MSSLHRVLQVVCPCFSESKDFDADVEMTCDGVEGQGPSNTGAELMILRGMQEVNVKHVCSPENSAGYLLPVYLVGNGDDDILLK